MSIRPRPGRLSAGWLRDTVAPPRCLACRRLVATEPLEGLCPRCRAELGRPFPAPEPPPGIRHAIGVCAYRGAAAGLVAAIKRGGLPAAAETAAELCAERLGPLHPDTAVVPVPSSPLRALRRGDDPALALAAALAPRLDRPLRPILIRSDLGRQRGRDRRDRLARPPAIAAGAPAPARTLLVDDVTTTGATLAAAAAALLRHGAVVVDAITLAVTPAPGRR